MTDTKSPPATPFQAPPPSRSDRPLWRDSRGVLWTIILPLVVIVAAGGIRFYRLGLPERCYFDETYYYYDARDYLETGTEAKFAVHPPVGKWLIAGGLAAFGIDDDSPVQQAITVEDDNCLVEEDDGEGPNPEVRAREGEEAFARRAMSAFFGTGAVAVAYFVGLRLFRRRSAALLGAALLATDGMAVTMSRISMLDIFLQFFVLLGVLALLIDRDHLWRRAPTHPVDDGDDPPPTEAANRTWLWLAGLFLGLAVATKWSGLAALGLAWIWVLASEMWLRRRWTGRWTAGLFPAVARGFLALVIVPIVVYLLSYTGWFANFEATRKADRCDPPAAAAVDDAALDDAAVDDAAVDAAAADQPAIPAPQDGEGCQGLEVIAQISQGWWEEQGEIFRFHRTLEADHSYRAPATTWALMTRPVAYYYESCPEAGPEEGKECEVAPGTVAEVLGMGNPALWWMALIGYLYLLYFLIRRRSWQAMTIALFLFGQSLPYLLSPRPVFLFYLTPAVPFIALTLAYLSDQALDSRSMRWVPAAITVVALSGFVFWAPVFLGMEISRDAWETLVPFASWV